LSNRDELAEEDEDVDIVEDVEQLGFRIRCCLAGGGVVAIVVVVVVVVSVKLRFTINCGLVFELLFRVKLVL
jgi:hypothetical protein